MPQPPVKKRAILLRNRKTSVSLEDEFWDALKLIAAERGKNVSALISEIDANRNTINLSSSLRILVLEYYRFGAMSGDEERVTLPSAP